MYNDCCISHAPSVGVPCAAVDRGLSQVWQGSRGGRFSPAGGIWIGLHQQRLAIVSLGRCSRDPERPSEKWSSCTVGALQMVWMRCPYFGYDCRQRQRKEIHCASGLSDPDAAADMGNDAEDYGAA
jgi:hypothetical protein